MSLKKNAVCGTILAAAVVATALAAKADTVVHYTFDDLGDVGTKLADSSTIQNKANPGTLDATVIGIHHGETAKTADTAHMPVSAVGYPSNYRICDYLSGSVSTNADGAISSLLQLRFPVIDHQTTAVRCRFRKRRAN